MNQSGPDQEAFTEIGGSKASSGPSRFAVIRQTILGVLLVIALTGLAWEYLVVRPGHQRVSTYLDELQERFIKADSVSTQGDEKGEGINPEFTQSAIREFIGFEPQEVRRFEGTGTVVEVYHWRRANLYQTLSLAIQFREKGVKKNMIFAEWYADLDMIPENPGRAIVISQEEAGPRMGPMGMGVGGGSAGQAPTPGQGNRPQPMGEGAVGGDSGTAPDSAATPPRPRSGSLVKDLWSLWQGDGAGATGASEAGEPENESNATPAEGSTTSGGEGPTGETPSGEPPASEPPAAEEPMSEEPASEVPPMTETPAAEPSGSEPSGSEPGANPGSGGGGN